MNRSFVLLLLLLLGCSTTREQVSRTPLVAVRSPIPAQSTTDHPTTAPVVTTLPAVTTTTIATPIPATVTPATTVPPSAVAPAPTATPSIARYLAHRWGSNLVVPASDAEVAQAACSSREEVAAYNHVSADALTNQQPVIVPVHADCTPTITGERLLIERGPDTSRPVVALTLDAGASAAPTAKMLQALRERHIHITFFLTGEWMRQNPDLLRQIVADGHEVANHSLHHPDFTKLDDAAMRDELAQTEALAQSIGHVSTRPFFRPPFGAYTGHVLDVVISAGYLPIYWTVDSLDSVGQLKSPAFLLERVTHHLPRAQLNGAIFLMHCGSAPTAVALPQILDRFAAMGVEVTTISRVLGR